MTPQTWTSYTCMRGIHISRHARIYTYNYIYEMHVIASRVSTYTRCVPFTNEWHARLSFPDRRIVLASIFLGNTRTHVTKLYISMYEQTHTPMDNEIHVYITGTGSTNLNIIRSYIMLVYKLACTQQHSWRRLRLRVQKKNMHTCADTGDTRKRCYVTAVFLKVKSWPFSSAAKLAPGPPTPLARRREREGGSEGKRGG